MGNLTDPSPVLLMLTAFSRYEAALDWARERAVAPWGPIALESERFEFTETDYYRAEMGPDLRKCFFAFQRLIDPAGLPEIKRLTNSWEMEYREVGSHRETRPLNLDPGYLTKAKLVLATTKDRDHRVYLSQGVFAEVTLSFRRTEAWLHRQWTYPDYQRADYHHFFTRCRDYLRRHQVEGRTRRP